MVSQMTATMTLRLPGPTARRLRARAKELGLTPSEFVRSLLERETGVVGEASALELTADLVGAVRDTAAAPGRNAREELEAWSPGRR